MVNKPTWRQRLAGWLQLAPVTVKVGDSPGWSALNALPHERDTAEVQQLYLDSLEAWRKNPIAWRIVAITTDYVVGDSLIVSSKNRTLNKFIHAFWNDPQNRMDLRLEPMCDELSRAGDLFVVLFRNSASGMSYIRFVTKDRIQKIETLPNDWETEISFEERLENGQSRTWLSPRHEAAPQAEAVMLHYSVNKPEGALLGESDLVTMIPWLLRYSRMLEDRVRLHWAVRSFLWTVTVPSNRVIEKQEQYRQPPDAGSIIVKDDSEIWEAVAPSLNGADAQHDMKAVRGMIDAGSGYPPHWRGEAADANLATATAMQAPTERHLRRRQNYFLFILEDILYQAFQRAVQIGAARQVAESAYNKLFEVEAPDVSRQDNAALAAAASSIANAFQTLNNQLPGRSIQLDKLMASTILKFAGELQAKEEVAAMVDEAYAAPPKAPPSLPGRGPGESGLTEDKK
jgi:hypothetical protein